MFIELTSIASVVNDETLMIYAKYQNGGFDIDSGTHIKLISKNLYNCLKGMDKFIVDELLYQTKIYNYGKH